jgi:hypothetical protein
MIMLAIERLSLPDDFVYVLPLPCDDRHKRPLIWCEKGSLSIVSCGMSINRAFEAADDMLQVTGKHLLIDVSTGGESSGAGRQLFYRLLNKNQRDSRRDPKAIFGKSRIYLCSLYEKFSRKFDAAVQPETTFLKLNALMDKSFTSYVEKTPCSLGGLRRWTDNDAVVARAAMTAKPNKIAHGLVKDLYYHPLSFIPRFFIYETNRLLNGRVNYDAKQTEQLIIELAAEFCHAMQHPFPATDYLIANLTSISYQQGMPETFRDVLFALSFDEGYAHDFLVKNRPHLNRILLLSKTLLTVLRADVSGIFVKKIVTEYDLLHSFIDLILGCWIDSFYTLTTEKAESKTGSLMDISVLRECSRDSLTEFLGSACRSPSRPSLMQSSAAGKDIVTEIVLDRETL